MRLICTLFISLLSLSLTAQSHKLKGIWRGSFVQKEFNQITGKFMEDVYRYEIQINQLPNNAIEGVTYSYKSKVFYGKASFKGIYTVSTQNILLKELKMLELKVADDNEPCLMTCYLDYKKKGKLETLTGTYTSLNSDTKKDCGEGTVYLEKVPETDFELEPFLVKGYKKTSVPKKDTVATNKNSTANSGTNTKPSTAKPNTSSPLNTPKSTNKPPVVAAPKTNTTKPSTTKIKPGAEDYVVKKNTTKTDSSYTQRSNKIKHEDTIAKALPKLPETSTHTITAKPKILLERENKLMNTIQVDVKDVQIDYYDNGQIDNDTITVYLDNKKIIDSQKLTYSPITLMLHLDENDPTHEIITVADNLGDVPPNTALMVITAGRKRYEVTITSDEKTNAKVIIEYKPTEVKVH